MNAARDLHFAKMNGAGNDFVLIDEREQKYGLEWKNLAPRICDRHLGVGADGLIVLSATPGADFRMDYYNADGSSGGMCGNGGRCAAAYVMSGSGRVQVAFLALDYCYRAQSKPDGTITLQMKDPQNIRINQSLELKEGRVRYH